MATEAMTAKLKWDGDATECGRFSLIHARIRHGREIDHEWRVMRDGKEIACCGSKRDAKAAAKRSSDNT